jgi:hypothetical protein
MCAERFTAWDQMWAATPLPSSTKRNSMSLSRCYNKNNFNNNNNKINTFRTCVNLKHLVQFSLVVSGYLSPMHYAADLKFVKKNLDFEMSKL